MVEYSVPESKNRLLSSQIFNNDDMEKAAQYNVNFVLIKMGIMPMVGYAKTMDSFSTTYVTIELCTYINL